VQNLQIQITSQKGLPDLFAGCIAKQHLQSIHSPQMSQPPMLCLSADGDFRQATLH
jgi:hypothetical protein